MPTLQKAAQQYRRVRRQGWLDRRVRRAVKRSKERSTDIADTIKFIQEGEQAAKDAPPISRRRPRRLPADGAAPAGGAPADGKGAPPADAKGAPPADAKGAPLPEEVKRRVLF